METEIFTVKNVKCGGCVNNIRNGLQNLPGVAEVEVSISQAEVTVRGEHVQREVIAAKLQSLGYPTV